jgi:hypothetical protein
MFLPLSVGYVRADRGGREVVEKQHGRWCLYTRTLLEQHGTTAPPGPGDINSLSNVHSKCVNSHQGAAQKAKDVDVLVMMLLFAKPVSGYVRPKALN